MKRSQNDTIHRVRAVRSWLEKAEASFDEESDIKGELNLMLAEAEMKNLRKHHPVSKGLLRACAVVMALCLAGGSWYVFRLPVQEELAPPARAAVHERQPVNDSGEPRDAEPTEAAQPIPDGGTTLPAREVPPPDAEIAPATSPAGEEPAQPPATPAAPAPEATAPSVREPKAVLSDRQVQATVQEARHTLRGTSITK